MVRCGRKYACSTNYLLMKMNFKYTLGIWYIYMKNHCALHEPEEAVVSAANHWRSCWPKNILCVCVACATTCCWDKGNYCQLHLDTSNSMLGHAMASHSIGGMAVQKNKRPQFDEKHVANRPTGSDYLFSPDGVPPTNIYLMSNMIFFFFEKSFRIQSLRILFDVCFIVCMTF